MSAMRAESREWYFTPGMSDHIGRRRRRTMRSLLQNLRILEESSSRYMQGDAQTHTSVRTQMESPLQYAHGGVSTPLSKEEARAILKRHTSRHQRTPQVLQMPHMQLFAQGSSTPTGAQVAQVWAASTARMSLLSQDDPSRASTSTTKGLESSMLSWGVVSDHAGPADAGRSPGVSHSSSQPAGGAVVAVDTANSGDGAGTGVREASSQTDPARYPWKAENGGEFPVELHDGATGFTSLDARFSSIAACQQLSHPRPSSDERRIPSYLTTDTTRAANNTERRSLIGTTFQSSRTQVERPPRHTRGDARIAHSVRTQRDSEGPQSTLRYTHGRAATLHNGLQAAVWEHSGPYMPQMLQTPSSAQVAQRWAATVAELRILAACADLMTDKDAVGSGSQTVGQGNEKIDGVVEGPHRQTRSTHAADRCREWRRRQQSAEEERVPSRRMQAARSTHAAYIR